MHDVAVEFAERLDAHPCGGERRDYFAQRVIPLDGRCLRSWRGGVSIGHATQPKAFHRREIGVEDFWLVGAVATACQEPLLFGRIRLARILISAPSQLLARGHLTLRHMVGNDRLAVGREADSVQRACAHGFAGVTHGLPQNSCRRLVSSVERARQR
jgi:hypothetical protein